MAEIYDWAEKGLFEVYDWEKDLQTPAANLRFGARKLLHAGREAAAAAGLIAGSGIAIGAANKPLVVFSFTGLGFLAAVCNEGRVFLENRADTIWPDD